MKEDGYDIQIERTENRINILLVENEAFDGRMIVKAGEREEFLTPWVRKLIGQKKEAGLKGTTHLARLLNRSIAFEKGKNEKGFISPESLNSEIIKLRKEMLKERKEDGKRKYRDRYEPFC